MLERFRRARRRRAEKSRGQSLVELVLILPVFLLIVMIGLDFGRLFQGWVELQQAARIGANYVSTNDNWTQPQLNTLVSTDASTSDCAQGSLTATEAAAFDTLPSMKVTVTCQFTLISPLGSLVQLASGSSSVPATYTLSASAVFPQRHALVAGAASGTAVPTPNVSVSCSTSIFTVSCQGTWSGSVATFGWTWGDGSAAVNGCSNANPTSDGYCLNSYTYSTAGTYTVTFTVTDINVNSASASQTVSVAASLLATQITVCRSGVVNCTPTATTSVVKGSSMIVSAKLTTAGTGISGQPLVFTLKNGSGVVQSGWPVTLVTTSPYGVAYNSATISAPSSAGTYSITVTYAGNATYAKCDTTNSCAPTYTLTVTSH